MNKKKLMAMLLSLCLVMALGVGATLAYFTSTTNKLTNSFTVGNVTAELYETVGLNDETTTDVTDGKTYTNIQPGDILTKMPIMTIKQGSSKCYAFIKVTGIDDMKDQHFELGGLNSTNWEKVANVDKTTQNIDFTKVDGIYRYRVSLTGNSIIDASISDQALPAIFQSLSYDSTVIRNPTDFNVEDVTIIGCAVQSNHVDDPLNETIWEP